MMVVSIFIQIIILVVAMVIAGLIMRWIIANPEKCKVAWKKTRKYMITPVVYTKATRSYLNWKKVKMDFTYRECVSREWEKYNKKQSPDKEYFRS